MFPMLIKKNQKNILKIIIFLSQLQNIMLFPSQMLVIEGVYTEEDKDNKKFVAENIYRSEYIFNIEKRILILYFMFKVHL